jgi:glycosyltransferase involved in cell wall biosynthesis
MTACLFGTYVRAHHANRLLELALAGANLEVIECHEPLWEETRVKARSYFRGVSLARLAARYVAVARRLVVRWRARSGPPPLVVVGFGGQLDVLLARRYCRPRAALVFAPLVSLTETLVEDRRVFASRGAVARAVAWLDRASLRAADLVLADTQAHADYLARLGAPRVVAWHLGVQPEFLAPLPAPSPSSRRVLFYGGYLPLHGIDTIVTAAGQLRERAEFVLIGSGPERPRMEVLARAVRAPVVFRDEVPRAALPGELARAAVVLGVFGVGQKAAMVVPNKVYEAVGAGRPLVTRDGPAIREVLRPGEHFLACPPGDADAVAAAVGRLLTDRRAAERLGRAARARMLETFSPAQQAARLGSLLSEQLGLDIPSSPAPRAVDAGS